MLFIKKRLRPMWRLAIYGGAIFVVVGGTLLGAVLRGPTQGKLLYYQYCVANSHAPAGQVVYQFSPALLETSDPDRFFGIPVKADTHDAHGSHPQAVDDDGCEELPPHVAPAGGVGESPDLDMYNQYLKFALTDDMQVLFAGELTSANGQNRIVLIEYGPDPRPSVQRMAFETLVIEPATFSAEPRILMRQRISANDLHLGYVRTTRYAGQRDNQDAGSFHLLMEQNSGRKMITGTLTSDGRRVTLREDLPPAASQ